MTATNISPGDPVLARTAFGELVPRRAVTGPMMGEDFMVVRVCTDEEWTRAQAEQRPPASTPWPVEDVLPAHESVDA